MDFPKNLQTYKIPENWEDLIRLAMLWDELEERIRNIAINVCGCSDRMCVESWSPNELSGEQMIDLYYLNSCRGESYQDDIAFPAKYLWMSEEDAKKDWEARLERERQEEERKRKEAKLKGTAEQWRKDYERYQELKARFECMDKSVGTPEECCGTCGHKIWGAGPKDDGYLICTDKHEIRTRHSVCLDWVPEDKDDA